MQKVLAEFFYTINGIDYRFQCPPNAPLQDAKEAVFLLLKDFGVIEDSNKKLEEKNQQTETPKEEVTNVE